LFAIGIREIPINDGLWIPGNIEISVNITIGIIIRSLRPKGQRQ